MKNKLKWIKTQYGNYILNDQQGKVYLSFRSNENIKKTLISLPQTDKMDTCNPETAIVLIGDKKDGNNRYLIFRGDWREKLEKFYPKITVLKEYWKKYGGHSCSDNLKN